MSANSGSAAGGVLEPGCGSGNFIAFAPPTARLTGVELEPVTAAIAEALYPDARIRCESFADTKIAEESFELVIGNVPFGAVTLNDRVHNRGGHTIHNHFIVKSLRLTRPGGIVAVLTSRYTMDGRRPGCPPRAGRARRPGRRGPADAHEWCSPWPEIRPIGLASFIWCYCGVESLAGGGARLGGLAVGSRTAA